MITATVITASKAPRTRLKGAAQQAVQPAKSGPFEQFLQSSLPWIIAPALKKHQKHKNPESLAC